MSTFINTYFILKTSNVTGCHRGPKRKLLGWLQSAVTKTDVRLQHAFIMQHGIACFFCAMRVLDVQASSSSLGYLCAKVHFVCNLHCWASQWKNMRTHSITYLFTQLIWCPGNWSFCLGKYL